MSSRQLGGDELTLGVKGRLSNQEMETLRNKVLYCHQTRRPDPLKFCETDRLTGNLGTNVSDLQLAQAVAYDHMPLDAKRAERHAKALVATKPMTKLYRKVDNDPVDHHLRPGTPLTLTCVLETGNWCWGDNNRTLPTGKKTLASIQYERKFIEKSFDSLKIAPPTRSISVAAKTVLQDEYVTRPRHVSSIPVNLSASLEDSEGNNNSKSGKRLAPAPIPQVFIL